MQNGHYKQQSLVSLCPGFISPPSSSRQSLVHAWCTLSGCPCKDCSLRRSQGSTCSDHSADCVHHQSAWVHNDHFEHLRSHAASLSIKAHSRREHSPLNTRQNRRDIIRRTPPILQNIQAQLSSIINIRMEHLANKLDARRFVWVLFFEVHDESECAVFERRVRRPDDDCVPVHAVESAAIRPR